MTPQMQHHRQVHPRRRNGADTLAVVHAMTTWGFIGSGNIGSTVARLAIAAGHDVVLSNSRGPRPSRTSSASSARTPARRRLRKPRAPATSSS